MYPAEVTEHPTTNTDVLDTTTKVSRTRWNVLVVGASMPIVVAPNRRSRQDGAYGEVLEWILSDLGYNVTVSHSCRAFDQINQGARRLIELAIGDFPDVLVFHFGFNECRPPAVPWKLMHHIHKLYWSQAAHVQAYKRFVVPSMWKVVAKYQYLTSAALGQRTWRMHPDRFARELARVIKFGRRERMLVLLPDLNPPGRRILELVPGLDERCIRYRQVQAEVVASFDDPNVRLVPVSKIVDDLGVEEGLPDNLHLSPEGHRRLGEMLAAEVAPWLDAQGAERHGRAVTER